LGISPAKKLDDA